MGTNRRAIAISTAALLVLGLAAPAAAQDASPAPDASPAAADGQLARILEAGVIRMSTDPAYPPQSFLDTDGTLKGFDIDVGNGDRQAPGGGHHLRDAGLRPRLGRELG